MPDMVVHQPEQKYTAQDWRRLLTVARHDAPVVVRVTMADGTVIEADKYRIVVDGPRLVIDA